jgi:hypothetical protein
MTFLEYLFPLARQRYLDACQELCLAETNFHSVYLHYYETKRHFEAIQRLLKREISRKK